MEKLILKDRIVIEINSESGKEITSQFLYELLGTLAAQIADGHKGGSMSWDEKSIPASTEVLWEHECREFGGFKMGDRSLIRDAYYGAKEFWEVSCVSKEDIEKEGFDASNLTDEDMTRIASHQDDLMKEGCDYWTALDGSCEYWEVPRKEEDDE